MCNVAEVFDGKKEPDGTVVNFMECARQCKNYQVMNLPKKTTIKHLTITELAISIRLHYY